MYLRTTMKEEVKKKVRYNFKLNPDLMDHVKVKAVKRRKNLTQYVEAALRKVSNFKEELT